MVERLAAFAADPAESRGRLYPEPVSPTRTEFQRDRDRIIHSTAFRRLKDKTQVFLFDEGDHYRTRLTHTIEVAQIARDIARALTLNEDLAEALALAHDLGHPPFGHAGERALAAAMADDGGFDHNAQTLRVVTLLERRYPGFDGLNLSWETLEGLVKHNGPLHPPLPFAVAEYAATHDLWLGTHASAEAQAAAIADDIAYDTHDIDDGLRAGLLTLDAIAEVPPIGEHLAAIRREHPDLSLNRTRAELVRRLISALVNDVIDEARRRLADLAPRSADDIRRAGRPIVGFSAGMSAVDSAIKERLGRDVYRQSGVLVVMGRAETVVRDLFGHYRAHPSALPDGWREAEGDKARVVADFLAGMTDRYALLEHARFFGGAAELR
ncbi:MAG TPA: deoxyguanosinetriphosphate triphosphohydrolase [Bauldia sp.]|nr:deoxyguanosinetriphosphate triphosphohydrolase [Bauldia sp.]